jgi:PTS system nitrogen regulatory IIA component
MKDMMDILQAREKDVLRMIKDGGMPAHRINYQYMFNKQEIKEWIIKNGIKINGRFLELKLGNIPVSIAGLINRGGILRNLSGVVPSAVLAEAVSKMDLPPEITKEQVLTSLLEREEMMPTAVGRGIAIPHPRNPIVADIQHESITMCMLSKPVEYHAMDFEPVNTMFIVLSANAGRHLEILSKLLYFCQQDDFISLLKNSGASKDILSYIKKAEAVIEAGRK